MTFEPTPLRLLFPLAVLGTLVTACALAFALLTRRRALARATVRCALAAGAAYLALLPISGWLLPGKDLAPGEEKVFCGLDCDLAVSVVASDAGDGIVAPTGPLPSRGTIRAVRVRVRSDAKRVSMDPTFLRAWLVTEDGRRFDPEIVEGGGDRFRPFLSRLAPGASSEAVLVFDVPEDAPDARLLVGIDGGVTRFVPGAENALFHRRTGLLIPGASEGGARALPR